MIWVCGPVVRTGGYKYSKNTEYAPVLPSALRDLGQTTKPLELILPIQAG